MSLIITVVCGIIIARGVGYNRMSNGVGESHHLGVIASLLVIMNVASKVGYKGEKIWVH